HMNKAKREIIDAMPVVDVVIEVLDARIPRSSENPLIASLSQNRPILKVLNKCDLADPEVTALWLSTMGSGKERAAVALSMKDPLGARIVMRQCRKLAPDRGTVLRPLRVMILGIPNVGKSTLINHLVSRKAAKVADEPAVTKMQQKIELEKGFLLVDTPGITWPKFENEAGYRLAATGAIGRNAMDVAEVAEYAADYLLANYPGLIADRYRIEPKEGNDLVEQIGRQRGCLKSGGSVDMEKASKLFLQEFRSGKIGRISLEKPQSEVK
ncbi:MAG TPA: ribosome biogenesis GTPase YlqF, partial [Burkholderiales bacterium]|nr:ribosome biogenesis GTPase YlqF [Burkholderiales bacterium]